MDVWRNPMERFNALQIGLLLSIVLCIHNKSVHASEYSESDLTTEKFFVGKITKKTSIKESDDVSPFIRLVNTLDLSVIIADKLEDILQPIMRKKIPIKHHELLINHFKNKIQSQPQHIETLQMSYIDSFNLSEAFDSTTATQITELFKKYGTKPMIEVAHELKNIIEKNIKSPVIKKYIPNHNTHKIERFTQCILELVKELKPILRWLIDDTKVIQAAVPEIESMLSDLEISIDDLIALISLKPAQEFFKICCTQEDKIIATFQEWGVSVLNQILQELKKEKS